MVIVVSCSDTKINSNSNGSDEDYISISNTKIDDLKYLIGIRVRQLSEEKTLDDQFQSKQDEIELRFNDEIKKYMESEGFTELDFESDTTFVAGEPLDDYHIRKNRVSVKINELESQKDAQISELRNSILSDLISNDKYLKTLVAEYKTISKKRSDILSQLGIPQSDSAKFYKKKLRSDLKDELWDEIGKY